jgi:ribulose-5-phosphate 4-epimerase/fuculose-1-phosphate aldolase
MDSPIFELPTAPDHEETEEQVRQDLACAYRLIAHLGMTDTVYTHLSVRVPGPGNFFLVNPYGLMFDEITASSLVKVDADGAPAQKTGWPVNPAGFVIHSAIHMSEPNAHCVMHTHTLAGMTVAAQQGGLLPLNQISMEFIGEVAMHEYEGVADDDNLSERARLVRDLGAKPCMILRNHGLLTVGPSLAIAFFHMWRLQRACEAQVMTDAMAGANIPVPAEVALRNVDDANNFGGDGSVADKFFEGLVRKVNRLDPAYAT